MIHRREVNECHEWTRLAVCHNNTLGYTGLVFMYNLMILQVVNNLCVLYIPGVYECSLLTNGREFRGEKHSPDSKMGKTFATRQTWGMQPGDKDRERRANSMGPLLADKCLSILLLKPAWSEAVEILSRLSNENIPASLIIISGMLMSGMELTLGHEAVSSHVNTDMKASFKTCAHWDMGMASLLLSVRMMSGWLRGLITRQNFRGLFFNIDDKSCLKKWRRVDASSDWYSLSHRL